MPIQRITIVGLGLIGGSLALALRRSGFHGELAGCDRPEVLATAIGRGVVARGSSDPLTAAQGSDVVVLATPVGAVIDLIERLGPVLPATTLITDVGSTKREIADRAQQVFGTAAATRFLPSHPMAGAENAGLDHAHAELFRNAPWIFCPFANGSPKDSVMATGERGDPSAFGAELPSVSQEWINLISSLGATPVFLDPARHDRLVAWTSHLPQLISTSLASAIEAEFPDDPILRQIAGRGLHDMTRLAASSYTLWRDIVATNAKNLADVLNRYEQHLSHLRDNLRSPALREEFDAANRFRKNLKP